MSKECRSQVTFVGNEKVKRALKNFWQELDGKVGGSMDTESVLTSISRAFFDGREVRTGNRYIICDSDDGPTYCEDKSQLAFKSDYATPVDLFEKIVCELHQIDKNVALRISYDTDSNEWGFIYIFPNDAHTAVIARDSLDITHLLEDENADIDEHLERIEESIIRRDVVANHTALAHFLCTNLPHLNTKRT